MGCAHQRPLQHWQTQPRASFSDYRFEFRLYKDTVLPGEPIWVRASVTNVADSAIPEFDLSIYGEGSTLTARVYRGEDLMGCMMLSILMAPWRRVPLMDPDKTLVRYESFCGNNLGWGWLGSGVVPGPGRVEIFVNWCAFSDMPPRPPCAPLAVLPFTVSPVPDGEEEPIRLMTAASAAVPDRDWSGVIDSLLAVVDRRPQSHYAQRALYQAWATASVCAGDGVSLEEFHRITRQYLRVFPDSPEAIFVSRVLMRDWGTSELRQIAGGFRETHPRAPVAEVLPDSVWADTAGSQK
jgi:hypothetical protein